MESCKLQDPLLQPAPLPLCGYEVVFSMWTVRDENTVDTRQEPTKTVMILWHLDRRWQQVRKMVITRIVSTNLLFFVTTHTWMKAHCVQTDMLAPNLGLEPVRLLSQNGHEALERECANRFMRVAWTGTTTVSLNTHSIRTSGRNDEKMYSVTPTMILQMSVQTRRESNMKERKSVISLFFADLVFWEFNNRCNMFFQFFMTIFLDLIYDLHVALFCGGWQYVLGVCIYWRPVSNLVTCPTNTWAVWSVLRLQHSRALLLVSFQIAIQQTRRRGDLSGHLSAMHVFVPPHVQSCTARRVSRTNTPWRADSHAVQQAKKGGTSTGSPQTGCLASCPGGGQSGFNRAVKVFALQRVFALDYCKESTPALVAPKPASEQPRQAGLPDRLQSLVCRAASLSTGLNKKSAPSSGMVGVPDVSPQGRGADRTPEVRLQSWYDAGRCQLPPNLLTAIACLQAWRHQGMGSRLPPPLQLVARWDPEHSISLTWSPERPDLRSAELFQPLAVILGAVGRGSLHGRASGLGQPGNSHGIGVRALLSFGCHQILLSLVSGAQITSRLDRLTATSGSGATNYAVCLSSRTHRWKQCFFEFKSWERSTTTRNWDNTSWCRGLSQSKISSNLLLSTLTIARGLAWLLERTLARALTSSTVSGGRVFLCIFKTARPVGSILFSQGHAIKFFSWTCSVARWVIRFWCASVCVLPWTAIGCGTVKSDVDCVGVAGSGPCLGPVVWDSLVDFRAPKISCCLWWCDITFHSLSMLEYVSIGSYLQSFTSGWTLSRWIRKRFVQTGLSTILTTRRLSIECTI